MSNESWRDAGLAVMLTQASMIPMLTQMVMDGVPVDEVMKLYHSVDFPESWPPGMAPDYVPKTETPNT